MKNRYIVLVKMLSLILTFGLHLTGVYSQEGEQKKAGEILF